MEDLRNTFDVVMNILQHNFVVLGVRINLLAVVIGCGVIAIALSFFFGVFDDDD